MSTEYVAATVPAKVIQVSDVTLFRIAMEEFGDPMQWVAIAELNNLVDPWIAGQAAILIPPVVPSGPQSGILGL
jgi:hypothetical protein